MQLSAKELDVISGLVADKISANGEGSILVTRKQMEKWLGFGANSSTIRRWTNDPSFPKPLERSKVLRWHKPEVLAWILSRKETEQQAPWEE